MRKLSTMLRNLADKIDTSVNMERITNNEIDEMFGTASGTGTDAQDYVIEHGTSGIWKYEKWASGKALVWGVYDATFTNYNTVPSVGWGAYFRCGESGTYYDSQLVFPFHFTTLTYYNYGVQIGSSYAFANSQSLSLSNDWASVRAVAVSTTGSQRVIARILAIGTWK